MKNILFLLVAVVLFAFPVKAQTEKDADRKELHDLLEERKAKVDSYSVSLDKHSGIFGNKTKNDVKRSSEVLVDIVKTDNRIISTLYRVVDFRTYEKVNMNYDVQRKDEVLHNLQHATDTLSKQVDVLKKTNHELHSKSLRLQWLLYFLCFLFVWMIVARRRKRTQQEDAKNPQPE